MKTRGEWGQVTIFVLVVTGALFVMAGLVIDGGYTLAAKRRAINEAEGAARAGAQAVDADEFRASGNVVLDPAAAEAAAQAYLARTGHSGTVSVVGTDRVVVDVSFDQPMRILGIAGVGDLTVSGRGESRAVRGVETES